MHIHVKYFDEAEKVAFSSYDEFEAIDRAVKAGVEVSIEDFVANGLFREQKDYSGFRNINELRRKVPERLPMLRDYFDFDGPNITAKFTSQDESDKELTELIGVATGISVLNEIYGSNQADWRKIPISGDKTFDFDRFSDGRRLVSIEAKGRLVKDPVGKKDLSSARRDIKAKKQVQAAPNVHGASSQRLIGTVAVVFAKKSEQITCYLVIHRSFDR